ncbi:MAG: CRISPR-associated endoribonuclease Cas6 [Caldimicrobium sp.]|nr:CRISPR-associated endoribonuclease Cas6 [Caldimicrobium sp.]MDW8093977.1 CRISPR-associated endoribonuclease Cas6 [Caldimicrobium sp.]
MRLKCIITLEKIIQVPPWFRQNLLSLIKEALIESDEFGDLFFKKWYASNKSKPFTYSGYFPFKKEGNSVLSRCDHFTFLFSTNDEEFLIRVYNGLLKLSSGSNDFQLFGAKIKKIKCDLLPERKFVSNQEVRFKTLAPFLLRDPANGAFYLYPLKTFHRVKGELLKFRYWKGVKNEEFKKYLEDNLRKQTGEEVEVIELSVKEVIPILCGSGNPEHKYVFTCPGIKGTLTLKGSAEAMKLIYDTGIGARRSNGFGMLEVDVG